MRFDSEGAHLDVGVLLLEQLAGAGVEGGGDVDEQRALEGGAGLVVDGVVAGLGGVQDDAGGVVDVEDRDVAGRAGGLYMHRMVVGSAVHCSRSIIVSALLMVGSRSTSCCSLCVQSVHCHHLSMQAEPHCSRAGRAW